MIVLGLSGALGHDPAACLVVDGKVVAMVEEERLTRVKHGRDQLPVFATQFCLGRAGISIEDVDCIATGWDPRLDPGDARFANYVSHLLVHDFFRPRQTPRIEHVEHHLAHAASAYYASGYPDAAVLVIDGAGEHCATSFGVGRGRDLRLEQRFGLRHSLGHFYSFATEHTGLGAGNEGKLMGLAAYGARTEHVTPIHLEPDGYRVDLPGVAEVPMRELWAPLYEGWTGWFTRHFGKPNTPRFGWNLGRGRARRQLELPAWCSDLAASVQGTLVAAVLHLAGVVTRRYGTRRLALAGGVALNCSANGALSRSGLVDELYVVPATHDAGTALGAAMYVAAQHGPVDPLRGADLGPEFPGGTVAATLRSIGVRFDEPSDVAAYTACLLAAGKTVGWFHGRSEIGPRALGQRSILALPRTAAVRDRVNDIKGREAWRPLSPSILAKSAAPFLADPRPSPFMLLASGTTELARAVMPAAVHADGTARAHHVAEDGGAYHRLLTAVRDETGLPAVLNTSFNTDSEPMVCTPLDAVRTFFASGLDALVIEGMVVEK